VSPKLGCQSNKVIRKLDISDFRLIYKTYIRPHQEFCIQAWSPHYIKDIEVLENAQKAATKLMVLKFSNFSYPTRLRMLGITSLKERRVRGDMIEVYKLMTGKEQISPDGQFFTPAGAHYKLRGHDKKLTKAIQRLDIRKYFFSAREWSTDYQQKLLTRNLSMHSRTQRYGRTKLTSLPVLQPTSTSKYKC